MSRSTTKPTSSSRPKVTIGCRDAGQSGLHIDLAGHTSKPEDLNIFYEYTTSIVATRLACKATVSIIFGWDRIAFIGSDVARFPSISTSLVGQSG